MTTGRIDQVASNNERTAPDLLQPRDAPYDGKPRFARAPPCIQTDAGQVELGGEIYHKKEPRQSSSAQKKRVNIVDRRGATRSLGSQETGKNIPYEARYPRSQCRHYSERSPVCTKDAPAHAATSIVRPLRDIHFPGICPLYTCSGAPPHRQKIFTIATSTFPCTQIWLAKCHRRTSCCESRAVQSPSATGYEA